MTFHSASTADPPAPTSYLGSIHTDYPIAVSRAVIEVGNSYGLLAGRNPVLLGGGVNLEDMRSGSEDGLLSGIGRDRRNGMQHEFVKDGMPRNSAPRSSLAETKVNSPR